MNRRPSPSAEDPAPASVRAGVDRFVPRPAMTPAPGLDGDEVAVFSGPDHPHSRSDGASHLAQPASAAARHALIDVSGQAPQPQSP